MSDTPFPEDSWVQVRYPLTDAQVYGDREAWPWVPGVVENQCGPDEWMVAVYAREVAQLEDGSPAPAGTPGIDLRVPRCFRGSSELRPAPEPRLEATP